MRSSNHHTRRQIKQLCSSIRSILTSEWTVSKAMGKNSIAVSPHSGNRESQRWFIIDETQQVCLWKKQTQSLLIGWVKRSLVLLEWLPMLMFYHKTKVLYKPYHLHQRADPKHWFEPFRLVWSTQCSPDLLANLSKHLLANSEFLTLKGKLFEAMFVWLVMPNADEEANNYYI